jgi:nucleotide-binding universal stress UspA family protein
MNRRIVIAIDADLSPATQLALRVASELLEPSSAHLSVVLLHVIPLPEVIPSKFGMSPVTPTAEQRNVAEQALERARSELHKHGFVPERIELLLRSGIPAEEIVKAANELQATVIVMGSRGNSFTQKMRRFFAGSTSRHVLQLASCPVLIASLPPTPPPGTLVAWYKEAMTHYLQEHADTLLIFTADEVAHMFAPPNRTAGDQEVEAASVALAQLAGSGLLCCHRVNGELRYMND